MPHPPSSRISRLTAVAALGRRSWLAEDLARRQYVVALGAPHMLERQQVTLRRLKHPGIPSDRGLVSVPGYGQALVTSYIPGIRLSDGAWGRYRESPQHAARLGDAILAVLEHAHERGVVHGRVAMRRVIVGESVGLIGFGDQPLGAQPEDDLLGLGGMLYQLFTGHEWSPCAKPAAYYQPRLGAAFDDWMGILMDPDDPLRTAGRMRSALRAVGSTTPPRPGSRHRRRLLTA